MTGADQSKMHLLKRYHNCVTQPTAPTEAPHLLLLPFLVNQQRRHYAHTPRTVARYATKASCEHRNALQPNPQIVMIC